MPSPAAPARRVPAAHVQAALGRTVQPKVPGAPAARPPEPAAHVRAAIQTHVVQTRRGGPPAALPGPAAHVQRALATAATPARPAGAATVQPRARAGGVVQRARSELSLPSNKSEKPPGFRSDLKQQQLGQIIADSPARTQANEVTAVVRIKVAGEDYPYHESVLTDTAHPEEPYMHGPSHIHVSDLDLAKLHYSRNDAEASLLPQAEAICQNYTFFTGDENAVWHHMVTLIGPYGPCDGCRMRMDLFRLQWLDLAREPGKAGIKMRLTLAYYYAVPSDRATTGKRVIKKEDLSKYRKIKDKLPKDFKTVYGVQSAERDLIEREYWSESKNVEVKQPVYWYKTEATNF